MTALVAILTVAVILLGVLVVGLLRSHAEILRALHRSGIDLDPDAASAGEGALGGGIPPPRPTAVPGSAVDVEGVTPRLEPIVVSVVGNQRLSLLAFLSSGCLTCRSFWDDFRHRELAVPGKARLVVVTKGVETESPSEIERLAPPDVPTVMSGDAWDAYKVPGSPYFVLVDGQREQIVGEGTATTWEQVSRLLGSAIADRDLDSGGRVDADLRAAGIGPGHPSLYPRDEPETPGMGGS